MSPSQPPAPVDPFVAQVIRAYLDLPDTPTRARTADRVLARSLSAQNVPLELVRAALAVASVRRLCRPKDAPVLQPIRSLHYFMPVIDELRSSPPDPAYVRHVLVRLAGLQPPRP